MHTLEHLLKQAQDSYNGVSFSPEKRGRNLITECQAELDDDLRTIPEEARERYAQGYEKFLREWISAKSRCLSPMITGPSGFPAARNQKNNDRERNAYDRFATFRERAKKAIARKERGPVTLSSELEEAKKKLAIVTERQALMKRINEAHRKYVKDPMGQDFKGFTDKEVYLVVSYVSERSWEPHPFAPYQLSNNNAELKRLTSRVAELERKDARRQETPETEAATGNGWRIVENHEEDRLQIFFDVKPTDKLRDSLKHHGFRWAPSASAWQRKLTGNARYSTRRFIESGEKPLSL